VCTVRTTALRTFFTEALVLPWAAHRKIGKEAAGFAEEAEALAEHFPPACTLLRTDSLPANSLAMKRRELYGWTLQLFLVVWIALQIFKSSLTPLANWYTAISPWYLLILLGCYCLAKLGYDLLTFNDYPLEIKKLEQVRVVLCTQFMLCMLYAVCCVLYAVYAVYAVCCVCCRGDPSPMPV
jgi:cellulose synthase/poly-beta-1,6-N-acetylglucosamine synthase-like glycosyltransferase